MRAVKLESSRLLLEPLSLSHLSENYVNWLNDSEVNEFLETKGNYNLSKLNDFLEEQERKEILFWAIIEKSTKKHIGNIKIDPISKSENSGEYGILIGDKSVWGQGFAKEASLTVINHCFKILNLSKITLGVIVQNKRSVKLYESLGFVKTTISNNFGVYAGVLCDSVRMEIYND